MSDLSGMHGMGGARARGSARECMGLGLMDELSHVVSSREAIEQNEDERYPG